MCINNDDNIVESIREKDSILIRECLGVMLKLILTSHLETEEKLKNKKGK